MSKRTLSEDPIFYRIEYARIAHLLHQEYDEGDESVPSQPRELSKTVNRTVNSILRQLTPEQKSAGESSTSLSEEVMALLKTTVDELRRLRWYWVGRRPPWYLRWLGLRRWRRRREYLQLAEFLNHVLEPATVVLYFSCLVEEKKMDRLPDLRSPFHEKLLKRSKTEMDPRREEGHPKLDSRWLWDYLSYLRAPKRPREKPRRRLIAWLRRWGRRFVAWLGFVPWRPPGEASYRVHYNLACMFSRLASRTATTDDSRLEAYLDEAERQLKLCIEALSGRRRIEIAEWARKDPGLAGLRNADDEQRFQRVIPERNRPNNVS